MLRVALPFLLALLLLAVPAGAQAASCGLQGKERKLGPTYTTKLTVKGVSCKSGQRFVKSYYRCRKAAGGADGRCRKRVSGYRCTERRTNVIRTQFDATVSCKKGTRRIAHRYTQFT